MASSILVKDIMVPQVITCARDEAVSAIAMRMREHHIGVIVVVTAKQQIEGIVTERDILNSIVCQGLDSRKVLVQEIMTKKVIVGSTGMNEVQLAVLLAKHNIKKLPIVDKGKLVGIVTQTDLLKLFSYRWAL